MPPELISQNLILVMRRLPEHDTPELLVGRKVRKLFEGKVVFPGGKVEGSGSLLDEAVRELDEEAGIKVRPDILREIGRLIIYGPSRTGTVYLYRADVPVDTVVQDTDELHSLQWRPLDDPKLTDDMPADTIVWLPHVLRTEGLVVHIDENEQPPYITIKHPNHTHDLGKIIEERSL